MGVIVLMKFSLFSVLLYWRIVVRFAPEQLITFCCAESRIDTHLMQLCTSVHTLIWPFKRINLFGSMCYDNRSHARHEKNRSVVLQSGILAYEHFKISRKCFKTICLFEITHQTTMLKPFGSQKVSYGTKLCLCDWVRVMRSSSCLFC